MNSISVGGALVCHGDTPARNVRAVSARVIGLDAHWLSLRWRIEGAGALVVPPFAGRVRADGLWQTTCFELFARRLGAEAYCELNLSPSEAWAAYDFSDYRAGMAERAMPRAPAGGLRGSGNVMVFDAAIALAGLPALPLAIALCAVIEEAGGTKSYWALAHPPGQPDFHARDCFALTLAASGAP